MFRLTMMIRALCWMTWMMTYIGLAAWVGEGLWHDNSARFMAVLMSIMWATLGAALIEMDNTPAAIAKRLLEDDA